MKDEDKIRKIVKINGDKLLILTTDIGFVKSVASWRKQIGIPKNGFKENKDVEELYKDEEKALLVMEATRSISKDFKIANNHELSIVCYLLYNKFSHIPLNYSINFEGDYLSVKIYKRPTKDEWVLIKKNVNSVLKAIESDKFNFLKKFTYANGAKIARPKRNLKTYLKIANKSKLLGTSLIDSVTQENNGKYTTANIETDVFPEESIKQTKKNITNIRKIRSRYKRYIKGTT